MGTKGPLTLGSCSGLQLSSSCNSLWSSFSLWSSDTDAMMRCVIVAFFILACLNRSSSALSPDEAASLSAILNRFPMLLEVSPMDQYVYINNDDLDYGGSWTKPLLEVCTEGDGWDIHGIGCENGHIVALRLSNSFGRTSDLSPLDLSGLEWLSHFTFDTGFGPTIRPNAESFAVLMEGIFVLPSLRQAFVRWIETGDHFPLSAFETAQLTHLELDFASLTSRPTMLNFSNLEEVVLSYAVPFSNFLPSASTLRRLAMKGEVQSFSDLDELHQLESLEITASEALKPEFDENVRIPQSLRSFASSGWSGLSISLGNASSGLETLSISYTQQLTSVVYYPPSLKSISLQLVPNIFNWPNWALGCELESFTMELTNTAPIPSQLTFCTSLKKIRFASLPAATLDALWWMNFTSPLESLTIERSPSWPATSSLSDAQYFICSLSSSLRELILSFTNFGELPACMSQFTQLEVLFLDAVHFPSSYYRLTGVSSSLRVLKLHSFALGISATDNSGWTTLATQCPNLISLFAPNGPSSTFPASALMSLSLLEELDLESHQLIGSLPSDFLEALPNLRMLELSENQLNGTIPSSGWGSIEEFRVDYNLFTDWSDLDSSGAPKLRILKISDNPLQSIPGDASFLNMPQLRALYAVALPTQQPIPAFWNNGRHKLYRFDLYNANFQGLMPNMNSPYLRILDVSNNRLCGPLPEITGLMALRTFRMGDNHFTGSIPASWGSYLAVYGELSLEGTDVGGEVPIPLLHPHGAPELAALSLSSAYFTGPLPNMTSFVSLMEVRLGGVNNTWDFCAQNPNFPSTLGAYGCPVTSHPSICECQSFYTACTPVAPYCASLPPISEEPGSDGPFAAPAPRAEIFPPYTMCITHPGAPSLSEPPTELPPYSDPSPSSPSPSPSPTQTSSSSPSSVISWIILGSAFGAIAIILL